MNRQDIKFTIALPPISKKNSQQILRTRDGKPFIAPSTAYKRYEALAGWYLQGVRHMGIAVPVNVKCLYYMQTHRRCDLTNLLEATDDVLVKYGVLADDHSGIIVSHDGSRVLYDKERPRTEVTISFYRNLV